VRVVFFLVGFLLQLCLFVLAGFTAHRESMIEREKERGEKTRVGSQKICHNSQAMGCFFLGSPEEWAFMVVLLAATVRV
jgi:hypothetical protein